MLVLGLTGSIASGKSTAAATFADMGAAIFDADRAVHQLYAGRSAPVVEAAFPGTVEAGVVDREALGKVHFALFVFKEADARDFLGEPIGFGLAIGVGDADENDEPALYLADDTAVNGDMSLANTLK
jgi:hypothetical protein